MESLKRLPRCGSLSTFGFGYSLDSKLLYDLSVVGKFRLYTVYCCICCPTLRTSSVFSLLCTLVYAYLFFTLYIMHTGEGSFGFIPDYSMVGTVFINWLAAALATASLSRDIVITRPPGTGSGQGETAGAGTADVIIKTGSVQYGQSRDFVVPWENGSAAATLPSECIVSEIDEFVLTRYTYMNTIRACIGSDGTGLAQFNELYRSKHASPDDKVRELVKDIKPEGEGDEGQVSES